MKQTKRRREIYDHVSGESTSRDTDTRKEEALATPSALCLTRAVLTVYADAIRVASQIRSPALALARRISDVPLPRLRSPDL